MALEVLAAGFDLVEHRGDPIRFAAQARGLPVHAIKGVAQDLASFPDVGRGTEALTVAFAGILILKEAPDLGEAEPRVVAQPTDEPQPFQVIVVEEAVRAFRPRGRLEQAELLVVPNRACREPELFGNLGDLQQALGRRVVGVGRRRSRPSAVRGQCNGFVRHEPILPNLAVYVKVRSHDRLLARSDPSSARRSQSSRSPAEGRNAHRESLRQR